MVNFQRYSYFLRASRKLVIRGWPALLLVALMQLLQRVANLAPILLGVTAAQITADGLPVSLYGLVLSLSDLVLIVTLCFVALATLASGLSIGTKRLIGVLKRITEDGANERKNNEVTLGVIDFTYFIFSALLLAAISGWISFALLVSGLGALVSFQLASKISTESFVRQSIQVPQLVGFGLLLAAVLALTIGNGPSELTSFLLAAIIGRFAIGRLLRGHKRVLKQTS